MSEQIFLRRYTSLASAIDLLLERRLTLLSPSTWDDGNDRHYLERYREAKGAGSVLALCFAKAAETYHHWRVFTAGTEGVCLEFDQQSLVSSLASSVMARDVDYVKINDVASAADNPDEWPFLKRYPFRDEQEYRLLHYEPIPHRVAKSFPIDLVALKRITTSPWLPRPLHDSVKGLLKGLPGSAHIEIRRTTLISNERWMRALDEPSTTGQTPTKNP